MRICSGRVPRCALPLTDAERWTHGSRLLRDLHQGIPEPLPLVVAAAQRAHAMDAHLPQRQRHLRRRRLAGAGAEQHNLLIARDALAVLHQLVRRQAERAGQRARIGQVIQAMPQVHDEHRLALVHHALQLRGFQPGHAHRAQKRPALQHPPSQKSQEQQNKNHYREMAGRGERVRIALEHIAEEPAAQEAAERPQQRARAIAHQEFSVTHAHLPCDGSSHGPQPRHKLRQQQGCRSPFGKVSFGLAHARRAFEAQPAHQPHHCPAVALPQKIPGGIRNQAARQRSHQHQRQAQLVGSGQRTGGQQQRRAGNRDAQLLHEHPQHHDDIAIADKNAESDGHGRPPGDRLWSFSIDVRWNLKMRQDEPGGSRAPPGWQNSSNSQW